MLNCAAMLLCHVPVEAGGREELRHTALHLQLDGDADVA